MTDTPTPDDPDLSVLPDLADWTDGQLSALAALVEEAREQRRQHRTIPGVISSLAQQYEAGGGDRAQLVEAVTTPEAAEA